VAQRFAGLGWQVTHVTDANDLGMLKRALGVFTAEKKRPTLIIVDSHIGYGAPKKQDSHAAHGEPLGEDEIRSAKRFYGWPDDEKFMVPEAVPAHFAAGIGTRGRKLHAEWMQRFERYRAEHPDLADALYRMQRRQLPDGWDKGLPKFEASEKGMAGREASGKVLNVLAQNVPWLVGGSADLAPSTKTRLTFEGAGDFQRDTPGGRNFHFGIRENAMGSIVNGLSLCKLRPYGSTFLVFSDYMRPAIRLSALMELPVIHIFTHDSISVGEDGPTHQPVEHLASLRALPGVIVLRPADANEVVGAWRVIMQLRHEPVVLVLSRQNLPTFGERYAAPAVEKGGYVLADSAGKPKVLLIGTGSEVSLCIQAYERLKAEGIAARVVSLPSWELFEHQTEEYRDSVLLPSVTARVSVEQGEVFGWDRFVGQRGAKIGMDSFGASAPLLEVQKKFGFTVDNIVALAKEQIARNS